jgi:tripartite-type tricarboxylate transporter receptor subunit TctC
MTTGFALEGWSPAAMAQAAWPNRVITLISPYAAGGTTDILARLFGAPMQEKLGQTVIVENRAGAGGNTGSDYVAKAKPDGYTLLLAASGPIVISPALYPKLPYQPATDFTPISPIMKAAFVVAVNASSGITSIKDLIAKGKSGKLNFASAGSGTPQHIIGEMFNVQAATKIAHVPYRGSGPAINDVLAGTVPVTFENPVPIMQHVKSGRIRVLALTSGKRSSVFPDIPTVAESGLPGFSAEPWYGLLGPGNLPAEITKRLSELMREILGRTETKARLFALGAEPLPMTPDEFKRFIAAETTKWAQAVKVSGATVE